MKLRTYTGKLAMAALLMGGVALYSCQKPFEGVTAYLSNNFIAHSISVQILDANPAATNPYPANPVVRLSGEAVTSGLVYTNGGAQLDATPGSAEPISGSLNLAIRPYTVINADQPLRFTVNVEADGYLPATKDVVVTSKDSLQYVTIPMIRIASAPEGVTVATENVAGIATGVTTGEATVEVGDAASEGAAITIPAATVLKDAAGNTIAASGTLTVTATHFDNSSPEAINSVPGGLTNVKTEDGTEKTFVLGGALDITMMLGNTEVKSFSQPLQADVVISPETFNPLTNAVVKAGDVIEVWSAGAGSTTWKKEGEATIFADGSLLKATMNITHLSKWMVAYAQSLCADDLNITYQSNSVTEVTHYVSVTEQTTGQFITGKKVSVKNGDVISFKLPADMSYTIELYEGSVAQGAPVQQLNVGACLKTAIINYTAPTNRPKLYFDLATQCSDGLFRYSGEISYKLSGSNLWETFTPASNGTLLTTMLEWGKTYDFRIIYKGQEWKRSRTVVQAEFRQKGDTWEYWGRDPQVKQTFFNAPTACQ